MINYSEMYDEIAVDQKSILQTVATISRLNQPKYTPDSTYMRQFYRYNEASDIYETYMFHITDL